MSDHSVALLSNLGQSHVESDILAQANIKNRKNHHGTVPDECNREAGEKEQQH